MESLNPFYKSSHIVVLGLVEIKILEALKAGKAVVSTSIGPQGLNLNLNTRAICVCDKVFDFANNVVRLLKAPHERYLQEQEALRLGRTFPTWKQIAEEYMICYSKQACLNYLSKELTLSSLVGLQSCFYCID